MYRNNRFIYCIGVVFLLKRTVCVALVRPFWKRLCRRFHNIVWFPNVKPHDAWDYPCAGTSDCSPGACKDRRIYCRGLFWQWREMNLLCLSYSDMFLTCNVVAVIRFSQIVWYIRNSPRSLWAPVDPPLGAFLRVVPGRLWTRRPYRSRAACSEMICLLPFCGIFYCIFQLCDVTLSLRSRILWTVSQLIWTIKLIYALTYFALDFLDIIYTCI